jgi:hypothetical protein
MARAAGRRRNPRYRERRFEAEPPPSDAKGQAVTQQLSGRRVPMVDRVEIQVINEEQPRWLAFLNGQVNVVHAPGEYAQAWLSSSSRFGRH